MKLELGLVALACVLLSANVQWSAQADGASAHPKLGAYDPHHLLKDERGISIEHTFIYWQEFDSGQFKTFASSAMQRGRQLMVTVEPWTRAANWKDGRESLLSDVLQGAFDNEIKSICHAIGAAAGPVMVSWGHEMDEQEGRYPWANQEPEKYKSAYRYFVDQCRPHAPNARFGWTPKGEETMGVYYPGDTYVDFIGLTLFDVQDWNREHRDRRSFEEKFGALHAHVVGYGKPIVLAEFGVKGDDEYRETWLSCAQERLAKFERVEALVYFNDRETWRWPKPYGHPDWRIKSSDILQCRPRVMSALTQHKAEPLAALVGSAAQ
jgi:beta-mannanase